MRLIKNLSYCLGWALVWTMIAALVFVSIIVVGVLAFFEDIAEAFKVKPAAGVMYYSDFERSIKQKERII